MEDTKKTAAAEPKKAEPKKAETKKAETKKDERVELFVPKGSAADESYLIIGLNGKLWKLPRGKTSMVPPAVKAEYDRSVKAQQKQDEHVDELLKKAEQKK